MNKLIHKSMTCSDVVHDNECQYTSYCRMIIFTFLMLLLWSMKINASQLSLLEPELQYQAITEKRPDAQYQLGWNYYFGSGTRKDISKAKEMFSLSAEQGYAKAQYLLAMLYLVDTRSSNDKNVAVQYLQMAANQNHATAIYELAKCYLNGVGVEKNHSKAIELLKQASNSSHAGAMALLGEMYYRGDGVKHDLGSAFKYLSMASQHGDKNAQDLLEKIDEFQASDVKGVKTSRVLPANKSGFIKVKNSTRLTDIVNASPNRQSLVTELANASTSILNKRKVVEEDDQSIYNKYLVGMRYLEKGGTKSDIRLGLTWLKKAADRNSVEAQIKLAEIFYNGKLVQRNYLLSEKWFKKAAANGDAESQYMLGTFYRDGLVRVANNKLSLKWFRQAANRGHKDAQKLLGGCRVC